MKEAYWGYWLVLLGVFVVVILLLIQNVTSNNTENSYTVRQINEASMIDAIDYAYYREYGELKINKEKFIESFMRRFAETASLSTEYNITIAGVYEAPPKVSVQITSKTNTYFIANEQTSADDFDMESRVEAILESNSKGGGVTVTNSNVTGTETDNKDSNSGNTDETTTTEPKVEDVCKEINNSTIKQFILDHAIEYGYYTSDSLHEKTVLANIQAFVCNDYSTHCGLKLNDSQMKACKELIPELYDSLPNKLD